MGANLSDPALEAKFPTAPNIRTCASVLLLSVRLSEYWSVFK
jgi:hypothetical protein